MQAASPCKKYKRQQPVLFGMRLQARLDPRKTTVNSRVVFALPCQVAVMSSPLVRLMSGCELFPQLAYLVHQRRGKRVALSQSSSDIHDIQESIQR